MQLARDTGALTALPLAVRQRIGVLLHRGEFAAAALLAEELEITNAVTENNAPAYGSLALACWRGEVDEARRLSETILQQAASRGDGMGLSHAHYSNAVLFNGVGRYEDALAAAERACAQPRKLGLGGAALVELVEAAAHLGETARAEYALEDITRTTGHSANNWALGIEARSRALLSDVDSAEPLYQRAIDRLGPSPAVVSLARAHLIYGEWLRRQHRRVDARAELRTAYETFASIGAEAFVHRARRELLATGETVRKRSAQHRDDLTPQEAQIARLAAEGLSNPEIGSRLFISARTVQYHLGKVFTKLAITSRNQLHRVLSTDRAD